MCGPAITGLLWIAHGFAEAVTYVGRAVRQKSEGATEAAPDNLLSGDLELVQLSGVRCVRGRERHTNDQSERSLRAEVDAR